MTKARTLADFISDGSPLADGTISVSEVSGAAPLASPTFTGNIDAGDNVKLRLGNSDDLQIYHDTSSTYGEIASVIADTGSGPLKIAGGLTGRIELVNSAGDVMLQAVGQEEVNLYYNNAIKLATTSTGIDITGDVGATTATITGKTTTDELDLNAIAATIADTAVDIFVYDTRKDSDGGAWRKRTQGTSWYNETLNTATRGSRKEFPAVAVIVAESNQVTIYDGDDPDLPMWAVLDVNTSFTSVFARNGLVCPTSASAGMVCWNFVSETLLRYISTGKQSHIWTRDVTGSNFVTVDATAGIVSNVVNDGAMTVLPNAPIDAATGLPVPTIAVATDGGVSVIKDDGTVVDSADTSAMTSVDFTSEYRLLYTRNGSLSRVANTYEADGFGDHVIYSYAQTTNPVSAGGPLVTTADRDFVHGSGARLSRMTFEEGKQPYGKVAWITSDYNTGWMNGDIKLATLSDTDDTNVTGSELFSGDAASDDTNSVGNWAGQSGATTTVNSTASYVYSGSYSIRIAGSGSGAGAKYYNAGILTSGKTYTLTFAVNSADGDGVQWVAGSYNGASGYGGASGIISASNTWYIQTLTFTATTSDLSITVFEQGGANSPDIYIDNVSVRLAEEDRSVNGNGLQVFGTVTKSAVATGADLVAYSGFSGSKYLEQPYNSDLDFGTGDFCYMTWFKMDNTSAASELFGRSDGTTYSIRVLVRPANPDIKFQIASTTNIATSYTYPHSTWNHICVVRKNGVAYIYVNAERLTLNTDTNGGDVDAAGADAYSRIGVNPNDAQNPTQGNIALTRISATAPSPDQILKIYNDEKVLFQENAKAVLYGSSDAVTALAYDDTTELLHVGTSAGRSVFQGLKRVDNTTTAVGAAISASNGLVADE